MTYVDPKFWASACRPFLEQLVRVQFRGAISGEGDVIGTLLEVDEPGRRLVLLLVDRPPTDGARLVVEFAQLRSIEDA